MRKIKYLGYSFDAEIPIDKTLKKGYNERNILRNVFDDVAANSALDYLCAEANGNQTQGFLRNNGFPTAGDRQFNRQLYGVRE